MAHEGGRVVKGQDLSLDRPHGQAGRGADAIAPLQAPAARIDRRRLDDPEAPRADARSPGLPVRIKRFDGLANQVANAPPLPSPDEGANELDVVDPGAAREMKRSERRQAHGGLETPQIVRRRRRRCPSSRRAGSPGDALGRDAPRPGSCRDGGAPCGPARRRCRSPRGAPPRGARRGRGSAGRGRPRDRAVTDRGPTGSPAEAPEASAPGSARSTTVTLSPAHASSYAQAAPIAPAPTTTASGRLN